MKKHLCLATALVIAALTTVSAHAAKPVGPVPNPYLAQSYNNQTHWNDAATDSVDVAVPRGFFEVTPESVQIVANESVGLPSVTDTVGGQEIHWWWSGFGLRKLKVEGGKLVEIARSDIPLRLPNYTAISAECSGAVLGPGFRAIISLYCASSRALPIITLRSLRNRTEESCLS